MQVYQRNILRFAPILSTSDDLHAFPFPRRTVVRHTEMTSINDMNNINAH